MGFSSKELERIFRLSCIFFTDICEKGEKLSRTQLLTDLVSAVCLNHDIDVEMLSY